jgi:hypothetical protein
MEIRSPRGFPQRLEKSLAQYARLFHSFHRLDGDLFIQQKENKFGFRLTIPITFRKIQTPASLRSDD